jgi:SAM-dependent methyltransferase
MMSTGHVFERFWSSLDGSPGEVLWAAAPRDGAADLARFLGHVDAQLPLVDVGCGNGTQTRFLARHFRRVIGTDIAPSALRHARAADAGHTVSWRLLDALRPQHAHNLHAEIGDANVYIRGVLHTLDPVDRPLAVQSLEQLLGARGTLYLKELSTDAPAYFARVIDQEGMPPGLARVLELGAPPGVISSADLEVLFPADRFMLLATGPALIDTTTTLPNGDAISVPALYAVLRRAPMGQRSGAHDRAPTTRPG